MSMISVNFRFSPIVVAAVALLLSTSLACAQGVEVASGGDAEESDEGIEKRDPFWPVGYISSAEKRKIAEEEARAAAAEALRKEEEARRLAMRQQRLAERQDANVKPVDNRPEPDWAAAVNRLKISGYAEKNGVRSCLIEGQPVAEGTKIAFEFNGFRYIWTVKVIGPQKKDMRFSRIKADPVK